MSLLCGYVPEVAKVFPRGDGIMEDLHGVVRSSATRVRVVGDDARKPNIHCTNERKSICSLNN